MRHREPISDIAEHITLSDIVRDMADPKKRLIRLPVELDAKVEKMATEEGASVNGFITAVLAAAVGYKLPKK